MRTSSVVDAVLDEPFPEEAGILEMKQSIRNAAGLLHEDVRSVQSWLEIMRDRGRDRCDPLD